MSAGVTHVRGLRRQALELLHLSFAEADPHGEPGGALVVVVGTSVSGVHGFLESVGPQGLETVLAATSSPRELGHL